MIEYPFLLSDELCPDQVRDVEKPRSWLGRHPINRTFSGQYIEVIGKSSD
jgi:hypothetical protein